MCLFLVSSHEDCDVAVDRFEWLFENHTGAWILEGVEELCPECADGLHCLSVFAVKVGGDDEPAVWRELLEGAVVNANPGLCAIPEVLVAHQHEVDFCWKAAD